VAFGFMKRRVQPLIARDTLGYQYMGDEYSSRMPGGEVDDDDIVERLGKIFKDNHRTLLAQSLSTSCHIRQTRLVVMTSGSEY
jgi:hypothetical protein